MRNVPLERDKLQGAECDKENGLEGQNMQTWHPAQKLHYVESKH